MRTTKRMVIVLGTSAALLGNGVALGAGSSPSSTAGTAKVSPKCKNKTYAKRFPKRCRSKKH